MDPISAFASLYYMIKYRKKNQHAGIAWCACGCAIIVADGYMKQERTHSTQTAVSKRNLNLFSFINGISLQPIAISCFFRGPFSRSYVIQIPTVWSKSSADDAAVGWSLRKKNSCSDYDKMDELWTIKREYCFCTDISVGYTYKIWTYYLVRLFYFILILKYR